MYFNRIWMCGGRQYTNWIMLSRFTWSLLWYKKISKKCAQSIYCELLEVTFSPRNLYNVYSTESMLFSSGYNLMMM